MTNFEKQCEQVSEELGFEIIGIYDDGKTTSPKVFEDDGMLHIARGNERVVFDISNNQMVSAKKQNKNAKEVLVALGIEVPRSALI